MPGIIKKQNDPPQRPAAVPSPSSLALARLTLTDFRCYDHARIEPGGASVVLTGPNGAGKTNLLEAISFLVPGRGLRGAGLRDVGRQGPEEAHGHPEGRSEAHPWAVAATVIGGAGSVDLGTGIEETLSAPGSDSGQKRERRVIHVQGEKVRAQAVLAEHFATLWLTPQMDGLFLGPAAERRRFLDRIVYGADGAHAGRITAYTHALRERARLLGHARDQNKTPDDAWLAALEATMAEKGVAVAAARLHVAERLGGFAKSPQGGGFPGAAVSIEGTLEAWLAQGAALEAEDRYRERLARDRARDGESGGASTGPHRSELSFRHMATGRAARDGSTGEQKALLIGLVLASARMVAEDRGSPPVLLLDEVAAHLDETRRVQLFDEIDTLGAQAWFTGTDEALFSGLVSRGGGEVMFGHVETGRIS